VPETNRADPVQPVAGPGALPPLHTRPVVVDVVTPAPRPEWRAIVAEDREALPEHAPEWLDAICDVSPYEDASRYYTFSDGRRLVLPLVRRLGLPGLGGWLTSYPPAWGMGGLVGAGVDDAALCAVLDDLAALRRQRIGIRPNPLQNALWSAASATRSITSVDRRGHVIDLSGGIEAVEGRIHRGTRKYIRRAERAGVRVEVDRGTALLDTYYDLYLKSIDRWADRQHEPVALARWRAGRRDPLAKLSALARHLGEAFVVVMAYVDDEPAFGSIMLLGQSAHVTRSAMDIDRVGPTKAGCLVHQRMLQLACEHGCSQYHLGESGKSDSLAQFKEGFGAVSIDYAEYRLERLPYTRADDGLRAAVKKILRFRDV
jgi:Acetyltransferase (GNAT) domain